MDAVLKEDELYKKSLGNHPKDIENVHNRVKKQLSSKMDKYYKIAEVFDKWDNLLIELEPFLLKVQIYLKDEWERVKSESKNGSLTDLINNKNSKTLKEINKYSDLKHWHYIVRWLNKNVILRTVIYLGVISLVYLIIR